MLSTSQGTFGTLRLKWSWARDHAGIRKVRLTSPNSGRNRRDDEASESRAIPQRWMVLFRFGFGVTFVCVCDWLVFKTYLLWLFFSSKYNLLARLLPSFVSPLANYLVVTKWSPRNTKGTRPLSITWLALVWCFSLYNTGTSELWTEVSVHLWGPMLFWKVTAFYYGKTAQHEMYPLERVCMCTIQWCWQSHSVTQEVSTLVHLEWLKLPVG